MQTFSLYPFDLGLRLDSKLDKSNVSVIFVNVLAESLLVHSSLECEKTTPFLGSARSGSSTWSFFNFGIENIFSNLPNKSALPLRSHKVSFLCFRLPSLCKHMNAKLRPWVPYKLR